MLKAKDVYNQILKLTADLISTGLCIDQTFPSINTYSGNTEEVSISRDYNSVFLKSISYTDMYNLLVSEKLYNIKMIDGALISMQYRFIENDINAHRLCFFPNPNLETYQNFPELYSSDEIYADIIDKRVVTVPLRFDFDKSDGTYKPILHPISHLTIGQYKNCRIPVSAALSPYYFVSFIIRNFYNTANELYGQKIESHREGFEHNTIFDEEKALLYLQIPTYSV